jgi:hypothetical protein
VKTTVVTTTIHVPHLLTDYCANFRKYGHTDVDVIVTGDRKTPPDAPAFCQRVQDEHGVDIGYLGVEDQDAYLRRVPALAAHLPYDSISRRNVAILAAFERAADVIITIDDDNFVSDDDFLAHHCVVGGQHERPQVSSSSGWFNVCELLTEARGLPFFHRGYPLGERWVSQQISRSTSHRKVVVNAGLWLGDPDIDALTRMDLPIRATAFSAEAAPGVVLASGTWCPFNSQNTALAREVIPSYFLSPHIGRYDDVWASYFLRAIADHLGDAVQYGLPIVTQERNAHDLWRDLDAERVGMRLTGRLVAVLRNVTFRGKDYAACYRELLRAVRSSVTASSTFDADEQAIVSRVLGGMEIWADACETVMKDPRPLR